MDFMVSDLANGFEEKALAFSRTHTDLELTKNVLQEVVTEYT